MRLCGLGFSNPTQSANAEFQASVNVTAPLAEQIMSQLHEPHDEAEITLLQQKEKKERRKDYSSNRMSGGILYPQERKELSA